jgi:hypothetical protein
MFVVVINDDEVTIMKKTILLLFFVFLSFYLPNILAQETDGNVVGVQFEGGFGIGRLTDNSSSVQLLFSPYFRLNENLSAGIGIGYMKYFSPINENSIPLYFHTNYIFETHTRLKPVVLLKVGYGFLSDEINIVGDIQGKNEIKGGLFLSPAIGLTYRRKNFHSIFLTVSFDLQNIVAKRIFPANPEFDTKDKTTNSAFGIKLGYEF